MRLNISASKLLQFKGVALQSRASLFDCRFFTRASYASEALSLSCFHSSKLALRSSLNVDHPSSNIPDKSGRITNIFGRSVSLFTTSSICLVTQSIRKFGNGDTLLSSTLTTSAKSHALAESKSNCTSIFVFQSEPPARSIIGPHEK